MRKPDVKASNSFTPTTPTAPPPTDPNWMSDPNSIAANLGNPGYGPNYNSNDQGSGERNWNQLLNELNPTQLLSRYSAGLKSSGEFGTAQDQSGFAAYTSFKNLFGRDPSASEFSQILPAFQGPNGNINGNASLANLQQMYKSNPSLDPNSAQNQLKPADIQGQVSQQFQSILGRDATSDEAAHFGQAIQTGQIDAYGLGSFLKQQPEYTNKQDSSFRSGLNNELQNYDTQEFNREKGDVISAYGANGMQAGFDANGKSLSPSLDYALTDLMGKISSNRSAYLASLSASQYGGNKDLAVGNYKNTLGQMYNQNQQNTNAQRSYGQQLTNQGFAGADYETQKKDYEHMLSQIPQQKPNFFDYLNTGANVIGAGASIYGASQMGSRGGMNSSGGYG